MKALSKDLNPDQLKILTDFILEFLPEQDTKRKSSGNELDYITKTLNKVFIQNFGFNLNRDAVRSAFSKLGYSLCERNGEWDDEQKKMIPAKNGSISEILILDNEITAPYIFINIRPVNVRLLMKTTLKLAEKTNPELIGQIDELKKRIIGFQNRVETEGHSVSNDEL